jgi:protein NrfC
MADDIKSTDASSGKEYSRREFITGVGGMGLGAVLGGFIVKGFLLPEETYAVPVSEGYLLVDTKKCAGCTSCMLACSMVHTGESNLSLSRIQILNNVFAPFGDPEAIVQEQCRQCPFPSCVEACPTGAMHAEPSAGNVRMVDPNKCIGCERCINACPFTPSRVQWDPKRRKSQKCDLCKDTPFMSEDGGPGGVQACVAVCPHKAITFTSDTPLQGDRGYMVNLRNTNGSWATLGFPTLDDGSFDPSAAAAPVATGG